MVYENIKQELAEKQKELKELNKRSAKIRQRVGEITRALNLLEGKTKKKPVKPNENVQHNN